MKKYPKHKLGYFLIYAKYNIHKALAPEQRK